SGLLRPITEFRLAQQCVTFSWNSLNVGRVVTGVPDSPAQLVYRRGEICVRIDGRAGPQPFTDGFSRDDLVRRFQQQLKDFEGLSAELKSTSVFRNSFLFSIHFKGPEPNVPIRKRPMAV